MRIAVGNLSTKQACRREENAGGLKNQVRPTTFFGVFPKKGRGQKSEVPVHVFLRDDLTGLFFDVFGEHEEEDDVLFFYSPKPEETPVGSEKRCYVRAFRSEHEVESLPERSSWVYEPFSEEDVWEAVGDAEEVLRFTAFGANYGA